MKKVLLIEDDPTMLSLLNTLLEFEGFQVIQLAGDKDVVTIAGQEKPDLILLDVHLRNRSGFDLLPDLLSHKDLADTRVLMTSGMDFTERSLQAGADGFILKPYMVDELLDKIQALLNAD